jgi:hypothetical protein
MTLAAPVGTNTTVLGNTIVTASAYANPVTVVSNAKATAATATELKTPLSYTGSNCFWVKLGPGITRGMFRVKYAGTVTTSPVIQVYGVHQPDPATGVSTASPEFSNTSGLISPTRLDNDAAGAGITLTLDATNDIRDGAATPNLYSPWYEFVSPQTGVPGDLLGCSHILVLCSTAANTSGAAVIEALFLN